MTCDEYDELRARADGRCELCGIPEQDTPHRVLFLDHDAPVGDYAVRGLLCNTCNSGLHLPSRQGPAVDRYLTNAWYLTSPRRAARVQVEAEREKRRAGRLASLDAATAEYRATSARLGEARARLKSTREALGRARR